MSSSGESIKVAIRFRGKEELESYDKENWSF